MSSILFVGFVLGIRHALEADHVATVASLAAQSEGRKSILHQALAWGVGHSVTLMVLGVVMVSIDTLIPEQVASLLEALVGALMILLGVDVIRRVVKDNFHIHVHQHDGKKHAHFHWHTKEQIQNHDGAQAHMHGHQKHTLLPVRGLMLGLVHGLAGTAAIILLTANQLSSWIQALWYFGLFGVGSILGMLAFSLVISFPLMASASHLGKFHKALQVGISLLTAGLGSMILLQNLTA